MLSAGDPRDQIRFIQHQQEEQLAKERAEKNNLPYVNLSLIATNLDALYAVEDTTAFELKVVPFQIDGKRLALAAVDPQNKDLQNFLMHFQTRVIKCAYLFARNAPLTLLRSVTKTFRLKKKQATKRLRYQLK